MKPLVVWFPDFYTEAHFRRERGAQPLVDELDRLGIHCTRELSRDCDFIFCGSFFKYNEAHAGHERFPSIPVIHYVWDFYPFQFEQVNNEGRLTVTATQWGEYRSQIADYAFEVWVPSFCTTKRVKDYTGHDAKVIHTSVEPFNEPVWDGGYVLNAMRKYPDPNQNAVKESCDRLGIECVETQNNTPWEKYKRAVAGCRLMVSAQYEASTGGLSLFEAEWLGKQVLISDSPRYGGSEYTYRPNYFNWDDPSSLDRAIRFLYDNPRVSSLKDCRNWITAYYSDRAMAKQMAERFRAIARC